MSNKQIWIVVFGFIAVPQFELILSQGSIQEEELQFEFKYKEIEFKWTEIQRNS